MTTFRWGDVVLVPFDFTDRSGSKWRPAVVISGDQYNRQTPDVVIASVTGNLAAIPYPGDHHIQDWQTAGLLRPSLVQTTLATVESPVIGRQLGRLAARDLVAFDRGLRRALGL